MKRERNNDSQNSKEKSHHTAGTFNMCYQSFNDIEFMKYWNKATYGD